MPRFDVHLIRTRQSRIVIPVEAASYEEAVDYVRERLELAEDEAIDRAEEFLEDLVTELAGPGPKPPSGSWYSNRPR